MAKDSKSTKQAMAFTIDLPEGVKKRLPRDFDIGSIGNIDLQEAEAIANENVLLLNEKDLIEGLEDFDLIPLKESPRVQEEIAAREKTAPAATALAVAEEKEETVPEPEPVREEAAPVMEQPEARGRGEEFDDGRSWIPLHELDTIDEHGKKWVPIHKLMEEEAPPEGKPAGLGKAAAVEAIREEERPAPAMKEEAAGKRALSLDDLVEPEPVEKAHAGEAARAVKPRFEPVSETAAKMEPETAPAGHVDETEEYMIWDMPDSEAVIAEPMAKKEEAAVAEKPQAEIARPVIVTEERIAAEEPRKEAPAQPAPSRVKDIPLAALRKAEKRFGEEAPPPVPAEGEKSRVMFIDDRQAAGEAGEQNGSDENRLERIISGIVQVDEGVSYLMREANAEEDRERIATITAEFRPEYEELFEDLEYKYADEEMDYIHTAIVEEDYSSYIREIDEFFGARGGRTVSARLELLGLTADEFDSIEDMLFKEEFKDVNLHDRYSLYEFDRDARAGGKGDRQYRYLLPAEESLYDFERDSIESDVSASSALIFEEDVQHIREQLRKRTGKTDAEVVDMVERSFMEKEAAEETHGEAPAEEKPAEAPAPVEPPRVREPVSSTPVIPPVEPYYDITDRVVILEDKADVERFVRTFPEPKQVNIKMLLKYLDGLFERLPEDIIRKFASSDYFNLYLKVLNELGV